MKKEVIFLSIIALLIIPLTSSYKICKDPAQESQLEIRTIIDPSQESEENWVWSLIKTIDVEVEVANKNFTQRDFTVELFLFEKGTEEIKNFTQGDIIPSGTINIDKSSSKVAKFHFKLDNPENKIYNLYAKAYDKKNESLCTGQLATEDGHETEIEIEQESRLVTVKSVNGPTNFTPGSTAKFTVEAMNLGNRDESKVLVVAYIGNLNIRETSKIESLGIEESKTATITFKIPENMTTPSTEQILFDTEFDYDSEKDYYQQSSLKSKYLEIKIDSTLPQTTSQTSNQTTSQPEAIPENEEEVSLTPENSSGKESFFNEKTVSKIKDNYKIILIVLGIITALLIIAAIISSYLKKKREAPEIAKSKQKVNEYLSNIKKAPTTTKLAAKAPQVQKPATISKTTHELLPPKKPTMATPQIKKPTVALKPITQKIAPKPVPSPQDRPFETNTSRTASQSTSQSPPQQPRSPPQTSSNPSSQQLTPAKSVAPSQVIEALPQTNPPSPRSQVPNKPSAPQPSQDSTQNAPTRKANKDQAATRDQPSSPAPSSNQTK